MNGAMLYWPSPNTLYVEGYALDQWAAGRLDLCPVNVGGQKIGLVLDSAIEKDQRLRHIQVCNGARATLGLDVTEYIVTEESLGVTLGLSPSGASYGTLSRPDSLLRASRVLVEERGCTALAIVGKFPDDEDEVMLEAYRHGDGVDCVGGAEAIISHIVSQDLMVPCAHAPALPPLEVDEGVSPRSAAEELGYTFLPCVLANLCRAPNLVSAGTAEAVAASHVDAVVVPASACGGQCLPSIPYSSAPCALITCMLTSISPHLCLF